MEAVCKGLLLFLHKHSSSFHMDRRAVSISRVQADPFSLARRVRALVGVC